MSGHNGIQFIAREAISDFGAFLIGPKKCQKIAIMYDHTGLSTKCTLIKTGLKNVRTGTKAKFRPFVDALVFNQLTKICQAF